MASRKEGSATSGPHPDHTRPRKSAPRQQSAFTRATTPTNPSRQPQSAQPPRAGTTRAPAQRARGKRAQRRRHGPNKDHTAREATGHTRSDHGRGEKEGGAPPGPPGPSRATQRPSAAAPRLYESHHTNHHEQAPSQRADPNARAKTRAHETEARKPRTSTTPAQPRRRGPAREAQEAYFSSSSLVSPFL